MAAKEAMITLEHLVDQQWLFPTTDESQLGLLIGSSTDTDDYLARNDIVRSNEYTPHPRASITMADWAALTPHSRDMIRLLVRDGEMRLLEGELGNLEVMPDRRASWEAGDAA